MKNKLLIYIFLIGTAISALALPIADDVTALPVNSLAGRDTNYVLSAVCILLVFALCYVVKYVEKFMSTLTDISNRSIEANTKVSIALNNNARTSQRCNEIQEELLAFKRGTIKL
jgi:hypothetical protein